MHGLLQLVIVDLDQVLLAAHILTLNVRHGNCLATSFHRQVLDLFEFDWFLTLGVDLEIG